jgi:hypothetical protein
MNYKKFLNSLLLFLLRKRDFLSASIYILCFAIIRELSALGFSEAAVELATEIKKNPEIHGWKYWGIRVLEVLLLGGNWLILIILISMLVGVGFLKYKRKDTPAIKHHFNSQLRTIETLIRDFQSVTAFKLLGQIQKDIDDSYLAKNERDDLLAWSFHLLGLCRVDDQSIKDSLQNHIKSYQLSPDNPSYKERACVSYCYTDQKVKALQLANKILEQDGLSERACAIKLITDTSFNLSMVPMPTKMGHIFRRLYATYLSSENKFEDVEILLSDDLSAKTIPAEINFNNIDYWDLVGRFSFYLGISRQPNNFASFKDSYKCNESIKYSNALLGLVLRKISDTELYKNYKAFRLSSFYYHQTEYLLNGNTNSVTEMLNLYNTFLKEKKSDEFYTVILICLNQLERYEDVIQLTPTIDSSDFFIDLMKFQALSGLRRNDEAKKSFEEYITKCEFITDIDVNNLIGFSDFLMQQKQDVSDFYKSKIEPKRFETDQHKAIAFCYFHRYLPEKHESVREYLTSILPNYSELRYELRNTIIVVLVALKDFESAVSLIEKYHDWKVEQPALSIYTECLLQLRNDSTKLLDVLKYRRDHFPVERLFIEEISIYELAENSKEILQISTQAKVKYPDNPDFEFYYLYSLYKLNKDQELNNQLNENLFHRNFHWKQKLVLAQICIANGKKQLGLELFYQETKQNGPNSPTIRQNYFTLTTRIGDRDDIPWPEIVDIDTVAKIRTNQEELLLEVDENSKKNHWLVKHIVGRERGESITVTDPITHKSSEITIVHIFDKYSGLTAQIAEEVGKSNFTGMSIRSVRFENSDAESISKSLVEAFGQAGDKDKIKRDEAFKKYYRREISFTELVRSVSQNKVLEIYSHLTSMQSEGFIVIPIKDFNSIPIKQDSEFVIDFTSLPILMLLCDKFSGLIRHKFVISQFAIELIENELAEARAMQEDGMVVSITSFGVKPTLYPPGYKEYKISTLEKILEWIKGNCETRMSKDKLDMIIKRPDLIRETDLFQNYFIDTIFISHGRTLISDDRIHNLRFKSNYLTIGLEYYLQYFYKDSFSNNILPILIENHYIGIRIDAATLMKEFKKPLLGGINTFHYCLQNLPFSVNHDSTVFNEALDFIRAIYIDEMPLQFKKETSQKVLINALKHYPNFIQLKKNIFNEIHSRFSLLPLYLDHVLDDIAVALDILNRSNEL